MGRLSTGEGRSAKGPHRCISRRVWVFGSMARVHLYAVAPKHHHVPLRRGHSGFFNHEQVSASRTGCHLYRRHVASSIRTLSSNEADRRAWLMLSRLHSRFGSGSVWVLAESQAKRMLRNGRSLRSYNDLAGRNGSGLCGDATMPRDSPVGSSSRCSAAREALLPRCTLKGGGHRTIDPHALKIPAPQGRNLH
jgi:hypothetical protein